MLNSEELIEILNVFNSVHLKLKYTTLLSDNAYKFINLILNQLCKTNKNTKKISIPYYHQSNVRIERVIRTIRETLKKIKSVITLRLKNVFKNQNRMYLHKVEIFTIEALKQEHLNKELENNVKYAIEFKGKNLCIFK